MSVHWSPNFDDYASGKIPASQIICVLCQNKTGCVCPPFGTDAYFALTDFRHGKITADDPRFSKWFRLVNSEPEPTPETLETPEPESECAHLFISWHGSRGECQECGKNVASAN